MGLQFKEVFMKSQFAQNQAALYPSCCQAQVIEYLRQLVLLHVVRLLP